MSAETAIPPSRKFCIAYAVAVYVDVPMTANDIGAMIDKIDFKAAATANYDDIDITTVSVLGITQVDEISDAREADALAT